MENRIEVYKFDKAVSLEDNIKKFILNKVQITKAVKQMSKLEDIYYDEVKEQEEKLHVTKDGNAMFVTEMEDSHLVNTVKFLVKMGAKLKSGKVKKYMEEIKKRGLVNQIIDVEEVEQDNPFDFDDDFDD